MKRLITYSLLILLIGCRPAAKGTQEPPEGSSTKDEVAGPVGIAFEEDPETTGDRRQMVSWQIQGRGINDPDVLDAMSSVPRHLFMPESARTQAYEDHAVPIGDGQTISQPYIVALMTDSLKLEKDYRVLEIGTGSGYQAAVLASIVAEVFTIEIREGLHERASRTLADLGFANVKTKHADGYYGWEEYAPFDSIMVTAAVDHIPQPLLRQLADGGRLILPLGDPYGFQDLVLAEKQGDEIGLYFVTGVLFVPMTGKALE
jgi:protein-L-isoaspartate(D-aspartate) O-methyltransferase